MLTQLSNVDSPLRIELCDEEEIDSVLGVDSRKRGLGKMLDIKEHEE